ncbi:MAG TPA: hypothetical protein VM733_12555 [Thermoanaerobaculia bacterium]|nr:hypothetical protein [Thermoanaerobaculia bacterium]
MSALESPRRVVVDQVLLLAGVVGATALAFWFLATPPAEKWSYFRQFAWYPAAIAVALWAAINVFLALRRWTTAHPAPPTTLGNATFWVGIVSAVLVCTGPLLGWLSVLIAPVGVLTGLIALALEFRRGGGHNERNALGLGLSVAALLVMVAVHFH